MKFSIGHRLFWAVLLCVAGAAMVGLELVRWTLFDNLSSPAQHVNESARLGPLRDALAERYRQQHDWSFLPANGAQRKDWLREQWLQLQQSPAATPEMLGLSPSLGYRIGLLDRNGKYLAGAIANRALIVFASIDTIRSSLLIDGEIVGYVVVATAQNPNDELAIAFLIQQQQDLAVIALVGVLLSALVAFLLATSFRRPIRQLVFGARRLENAQFDTRLEINRNDELGELAGTFNRLAAKLQDTEEHRRQWVADTSHELRTPLAVLRAQMESLQDGVRSATPENIALMLRQTLSLTSLVDTLYELARADIRQLPYNMAGIDVWQLVQEVLQSFTETFRRAQLTATAREPTTRAIVNCDRDRMRQVVTNLLENCVRYTAADGRIEVHGRVVGTALRICIDDAAPGVPEPALSRLGERFFRLEPSRNRQLGGAGLGLALSRQIVEAQGGRLEFSASPLGGLRAVIVLKVEA